MLDLDGKPLANQSVKFVDFPYVRSGPNGSWPIGRPWESRLVAEMVPDIPRSAWYLIHDGHVNGRAYGVGYDLRTNRPMAYFGRQGFSQTVPNQADWFSIKGSDGLAYVTTELFGIPYWPGDGQMYVLANDKLWHIDLGNRSVRAVREAAEAVAISKIERAAPPEQAEQFPVGSQNPKLLESRLVVRFVDAIEVVDPESGASIRYPLPADLRDKSFRAVQLADDRLLIDEFRNLGSETRVAWLDRTGQINDERVISIQTRMGASTAEAFWGGVLIVPLPALLYGFAMCLPLGDHEPGAPWSYASALVKIAAEIWPPLLLITAISLALAILAYRRQKSFGLPGAAAWAVFCFVLGVPGWIAYRFLWPWPPVGACPSCEHQTPLDRSACLDCGRTFPPPRLTGAEVFA